MTNPNPYCVGITSAPLREGEFTLDKWPSATFGIFNSIEENAHLAVMRLIGHLLERNIWFYTRPISNGYEITVSIDDKKLVRKMINQSKRVLLKSEL